MAQDIHDLLIPGPRGAQGPKGEQGPMGPQGWQGIPGPMGPQGPQGEQGQVGCRGPQGERGPKGNDGLNGAPGPMGPCGPKGERGEPGLVAFERLDPETLKLLKGDKGDRGEVGPMGPIGPMGGLGPQGPMGPTGPRGEKGEQGERGLMGPKGATGDRGYTGPKGEPGDGRIVDKMSREGVWTPATTIDYLLQNNSHWVHRMGHNLDVPHTQNAYVKNFKILGKTLKNYCNFSPANQPPTDKGRVDVTINTGNNPPNQNNTKNLYTGPNWGQPNQPRIIGQSLTLFYKMSTAGGASFGENESAVIKVTKKHDWHVEEGPDIIDTYRVSLRDGSIKQFIDITGQEVLKSIDITFYQLFRPAGETGGVDTPIDPVTPFKITVKEFMLLSGDWSNYVCPDYFWNEKSIGKKDGETTKYYLNVISRNKNLIDESKVITNKYLLPFPSAEENQVKNLLWANEERREEEKDRNKAITFLVHVKPGTKYALTKINKKMSLARLSIAGYQDDPGNGEPGEFIMYKKAGQGEETTKVSFTTGENTHMLALYLGRFETSGGAEKVSDILGNLQLEEVRYDEIDDPFTSYQPFTESRRKLNLPRQVKTNEYIFWDNNKRSYMIHNAEGLDEPTLNDDEHFVHTFDGMTYVYIESRVPTEISGDFPIKGHDDYYTKEQSYDKREIDTKETALENKINKKLELEYYIKTKVLEAIKAYAYPKDFFAFQDVERRPEQGDIQNFLKLPGGFRMSWQEVEIQPNSPTIVARFPILTNIIWATAIRVRNSDDQNNTYSEHDSVVTITKTIGNQMAEITIKDVALYSKDASAHLTKKRRIWVMAIGDAGRDIDINNEQAYPWNKIPLIKNSNSFDPTISNDPSHH